LETDFQRGLVGTLEKVIKKWQNGANGFYVLPHLKPVQRFAQVGHCRVTAHSSFVLLCQASVQLLQGESLRLATLYTSAI